MYWMRLVAAPLVALGALAGVAACSLLVDTSDLVSRGGDDAAAEEASVDAGVATGPDAEAGADAGDGGPCASCASGTRCLSSACVPSSDLVGWWSFEDTGDEVSDISGNGNRGARLQVTTVPGKIGRGVELTAGSCVLVPGTSALRLEGSTALTMMAWTKFAGCADPARDHGIVLNKENSYELGVLCDGTNFTMQEAVRTTGWDWFGTAPVTAGTWQHLAVTWDGTTMRHYLDGAEKYAREIGGAIVGQDTGLGIGCRGVASDGGAMTVDGGAILREWMDGTIDEVAVYRRALSAAEVRAYYDATR